jgi:hypothetical protein
MSLPGWKHGIFSSHIAELGSVASCCQMTWSCSCSSKLLRGRKTFNLDLTSNIVAIPARTILSNVACLGFGTKYEQCPNADWPPSTVQSMLTLQPGKNRISSSLRLRTWPNSIICWRKSQFWRPLSGRRYLLITQPSYSRRGTNARN